MKAFHLTAIAVLIALSGCKKDLDLESGAFFPVKAFLQSQDCAADCGEMADCEGQTVGIEGEVDESNVNPDNLQFYVLDAKNDKFSIEVKVDPAIAAEVFEQIRFRLDNDIRVRGEIEGYDQPMNFNCKRGFILHLENLEDLFVN
jgi:hypothetical protein